MRRIPRTLARFYYAAAYAQDKLNRVTSETWKDSTGFPVRTLTFGYDAASDTLYSASDPTASYAWTYDARGYAGTATQDLDGLGTITLNQSFDNLGLRTSLSAKIGSTLDFVNSYSYDTQCRMTQVTQTDQGDNSVAKKRVDFAYNGLGQFTSIARYKDLDGMDEVAASAFSYSTDGRSLLKDIAYTHASSSIVDYGWNYDGLARVTSFTTTNPGDSPIVANYSYDATSQLTDVHAANDESYEYDATGNRTTANSSPYVTGPYNRLLSDGTFNYKYDAEGNRTERRRITPIEDAEDNITAYTWDYRNRLTQVTFSTSFGNVVKAVGYDYDVFDRRVSKWVAETGPTFDEAHATRREFYVYDGTNVVLDFEDRDGVGTGDAVELTHRYLQGPAVDQILAQEDVGTSGTVLWQVTDNLGTVRKLLGDSGSVVESYDYDSFGNLDFDGTPMTRYLYTARELDCDTGLQYNWHRWYDSTVGRWLSEDPMGFVAGDVNVTRYVMNQATFRLDPSGLVVPPREPFIGHPDPFLVRLAKVVAMFDDHGLSPNPIGVLPAMAAKSPGLLARICSFFARSSKATPVITPLVDDAARVGGSLLDDAARAGGSLVDDAARTAGEAASSAASPAAGGAMTVTSANPKSLLSRQGPAEMTPSRVTSMAEEMRRNCFPWQRTGPIDVAEGPNGIRIILDGHHRTAAAIQAGAESVPIRIHQVSEEQWRQLMLEVLEANGMR